MTYAVSVIVPTYKRPQLLQRCLYALLTQDFDPEQYEIIIVDDAHCRETEYQITTWSERALERGHTLRYLPVSNEHQHGPAIARNLGWRAARGEIIAFTDDDCIPTPDWLRVGVAAFTTGVAAVSGRVIVPLPEDPTDYEYNAAHLSESEFVTANCFYRRAVLEELGGFDERFTAAWREDSDLFFALLERELPYYHAYNALVLHPIRPVQWGISVKQQRKSMFNALLYKKHPRLYRQKIQATPPWHYYGIVGALLLALVGTGRRSRWMTISGLGIWVWLTARFCRKRLRSTSHAPRHVAEMIITSIVIPPLAIFWRLVGMIKFKVPFL